MLCTKTSLMTASNVHLVVLEGDAVHKANPVLCPLRLGAGSGCREAAPRQALAVDLPHSLGLGNALEGELPNVAQLDVRDGLAPLILQSRDSCGGGGCRGPDRALAPLSCRSEAALHKCLREAAHLRDGLLCRMEEREFSRSVLWAADSGQWCAVATRAAL